jgi:hypothetical protein
LTREYLPAIKRAFFRLYCVKPLYGKSMATSSSPKSITASRTLQVVRRAGGGGGVLPASYQLSAGNFSPRKVDPILIYPRPDVETAAWTKHRRHYPGIGYRVPIGVSFGSGPLVYELIAGPSGASIGEFLVVSGDTLIPNEEYGVLTWANPTTGNHPFHVRVSFQDGFAPVDVYWTLEVTTTGTIFIDAVSGSDSTGNGTLGNPFQTINAWWKNSLTDIIYSGFQVCYRGGTHNVSADNSATGVSGGNWRLKGTDKPLVHYPYTGEAVIWDMSNTTVVMGDAGVVGGAVGSDTYFGKFIYEGGNTGDNPKHFSFLDATFSSEVYAAGGNGQRITFDTPHHRNFICDTRSDNNAGCCWMPYPDAASNRRHFIYIHRPTFENVKQGPNAATAPDNFNGYFISNGKNVLTDHVTCIDTIFGKGPVVAKAGGEFWCLRYIDSVQAPNQIVGVEPTGSYMPSAGGPVEVSYSKVRNTGTDTASVVLFINVTNIAYNASLHDPIYVTRCTLSRVPDDGSVIQRRGNWDLQVDGVLFVANTIEYLGPDPSGNFLKYTVANNPLDANLNLTGQARTDQLGLFGHEIKAE